jgi:3-oxoadipate enol-lactonase
MGTEITKTPVNGIHMAYAIDGPEGAPWLTMITGLTNDISMWDPQMPFLDKKLRVLRYDLRGQGRSAPTTPPYTPELLIADLLALWDHLGIKRSHLAGLGLGGSLALGIAIQHPGRVDKLVPCCCRADMVPDFAANWHRLQAMVREGGIEAIVEQTAQRWFSDDFKAKNPAVIDGIRSMIRGTSKDGYLGCTSAFLGVKYGADLGKIKAPTLFVGGAEDRLGGPPELMAGLAAQVPGARYAPVPGAAHIANLQNPEGFGKILADFLIS